MGIVEMIEPGLLSMIEGSECDCMRLLFQF